MQITLGKYQRHEDFGAVVRLAIFLSRKGEEKVFKLYSTCTPAMCKCGGGGYCNQNFAITIPWNGSFSELVIKERLQIWKIRFNQMILDSWCVSHFRKLTEGHCLDPLRSQILSCVWMQQPVPLLRNTVKRQLDTEVLMRLSHTDRKRGRERGRARNSTIKHMAKKEETKYEQGLCDDSLIHKHSNSEKTRHWAFIV